MVKIGLKTIIAELIDSKDSGSHEFRRLYNIGVRGVREFNTDVVGTFTTVLLDVAPNKTAALPEDYVAFSKVGIINDKGEILSFYLTKGNVDDRDAKVITNMTQEIFGKLFSYFKTIFKFLFLPLADFFISPIKSSFSIIFKISNFKLEKLNMFTVEAVEKLIKSTTSLVLNKLIEFFDPSEKIFSHFNSLHHDNIDIIDLNYKMVFKKAGKLDIKNKIECTIYIFTKQFSDYYQFILQKKEIKRETYWIR
jgi:hypothetical protein